MRVSAAVCASLCVSVAAAHTLSPPPLLAPCTARCSPDYIASAVNEAAQRRDALRGQKPRQWLVSCVRWLQWVCWARCWCAASCAGDPLTALRCLRRVRALPAHAPPATSWVAAPATSQTAGSTCGGTTCTGRGVCACVCMCVCVSWWPRVDVGTVSAPAPASSPVTAANEDTHTQLPCVQRRWKIPRTGPAMPQDMYWQ
jgi:hypothetical protein